jgi:putative FmdB family regulatory protein
VLYLKEKAMPVYEYRCSECSYEVTVFQSMSAPAPDCKCESEQEMKRLISKTSFSLKGGGWARDGYSSKGR